MRKPRAVLALLLLSALITIAVSTSGVKAQETFLWQGVVPSTGEPVISPVLEAGREHRIVAKGVFTSWLPSIAFVADAQYYNTAPLDLWTWGGGVPAPNGHSFLQINGMDVYWGPFNDGTIIGGKWLGHEYTIYYTGTGAPITFTIVDWIDGNYANHYCHILVTIYVGPPPPPPPPPEEGHSPGYWKHQFNAYIDGKGSPQESWADLVMWTAEIDAAAKTPPTPWDLPPLSEIDYDGDGTFETEDAYHIFNAPKQSPWRDVWIPLANWYNWAAGLGPYD